jgi:hypothetical protein
MYCRYKGRHDAAPADVESLLVEAVVVVSSRVAFFLLRQEATAESDDVGADTVGKVGVGDGDGASFIVAMLDVRHCVCLLVWFAVFLTIVK